MQFKFPKICPCPSFLVGIIAQLHFSAEESIHNLSSNLNRGLIYVGMMFARVNLVQVQVLI
jgi:hypothetical protein